MSRLNPHSKTLTVKTTSPFTLHKERPPGSGWPSLKYHTTFEA
jgi:hypothetical protein